MINEQLAVRKRVVFFSTGYIDGTRGINNWSLVGDGYPDKMKKVYDKGLAAGATAREKSRNIKF